MKKGRRLIVRIRSDSKSTVDQLKGISEIRDTVLQRICTAIKKLCVGMTTRYNNTTLIFNYLERTRNIAGLLLEQRRRKQREKIIFLNQYNNNSELEEYEFCNNLITTVNFLSFKITIYFWSIT